MFAAPNARFQLPFVPLGIVPEFGSTFLLPMLAGYQRAAKLLLLGQPFTAQEALDAGIVTAVVADVIGEAEKAANALAALPPESIRLTKRLMRARYADTLAATIDERVPGKAQARLFALLMTLVVLTLVFWRVCSHRDLYRWVDRQTGSVRYSTSPPPWYGDPEKERTSPPVEVIRDNAPGAAAKPTPKARWRELNRFFNSLPPGTDFARPAEGLRSQIEAYQTLSRELDRLDPAGAERRRAQRPPGFDIARERLK